MPLKSMADSGFNIKLDINNLFSLAIDKAEKYWEFSSNEEEDEELPKLASTYIHVGVSFSELATQILRSIPYEKRELLCESANTGELDCLEFIKKSNSEFSGRIDKELLRKKLSSLRYLYNLLLKQIKDQGSELVIADTDLYIDIASNVEARGVVIHDGEAALFNGILGKKPIQTLEVASRFEHLGNRALALGKKLTGLITRNQNHQ